MWCLARFLLLIIGVYVPEHNPHWEHFLTLLDIMNHVLSPVVHPTHPEYVQVIFPGYLCGYAVTQLTIYLQVLIADYLETSRVLYPTQSIIPKMHHMIHIPCYMHGY